MSLDAEKRRILAFVSFEKPRVLGAIRESSGDIYIRRGLEALAERVFGVLDTSLEARLVEIIQDEGEIIPDEASATFQVLLGGIQAIFALLSSVADQQRIIPRELYCYVNWFFGQTGHSRNFALRLHSELSTTTVGELLRSFFSTAKKSKYISLTSAFDREDFSLIQIPAHLAPLERACDWPLILHECVHALEQNKRYVAAHFSNIPRDWATLVEQAKNDISEAKNALCTEEFVCDALATHIAGPGYLWAFLRSYSSITGVVHSTKTHPRLDERADRLAEQLRIQKFVAQADFASAEIKKVVDASGSAPNAKESSTATADAVQARYFGEIVGTSNDLFVGCLASVTDLEHKDLVKEFLRKRPTSLSPDHLFSLLAFAPGADDPSISPLIADMLRLSEIQRRFAVLGLSG